MISFKAHSVQKVRGGFLCFDHSTVTHAPKARATATAPQLQLCSITQLHQFICLSTDPLSGSATPGEGMRALQTVNQGWKVLKKQLNVIRSWL